MANTEIDQENQEVAPTSQQHIQFAINRKGHQMDAHGMRLSSEM